MARIIFTALVESIRGSIAGTTFQRNAYGYTVKTKPNMVNPNSASQSRRKNYFQQAQQAWLQLTMTDRANWNTYAATYPTPSKHNPDAYLSGYNLFVRHAAISLSTSGTVLPNPNGAQSTVNYIETEIIRDGTVLELNVTAGSPDSVWQTIVYLTRPLKATQEYLKSWTREIEINLSGPTVSTDIAFAYNRVFGLLPEVGDFVGVDITFINSTNGQVIYVPTFTVEVIS